MRARFDSCRAAEGETEEREKVFLLRRAAFLWSALTLVGAVGVSLVAVVTAVVVAVARPVLRNAAAAVALELDAGAGVAAASLVAVVATVVVCREGISFCLLFFFFFIQCIICIFVRLLMIFHHCRSAS